jgi:hypothetical protein
VLPREQVSRGKPSSASPPGLMKIANAVKVEPVGEFELKGIRRPLAPYNVLSAASGGFGVSRRVAELYCPNSASAVSTRVRIGVSPNCESIRFASVRC